MKILAYQPRIGRITTPQERRAHVVDMIEALAERAHAGPTPDLIILPELATVSYARASFEQLAVLAEPLDGETSDLMGELARRLNCAVTFGFPREANGSYRISQAVLGSSGRCLATYDKLHMAQFGASMEQEYFEPGHNLSVFELNGLRFGLVICYDFRFPQLIGHMVDTYALDAIIHPVAFAHDGTFRSWRHFVICRALENLVYFLSVNRGGAGWGGSILCPPWIDAHTDPVEMAEAEEMRLFTVDKSVIVEARARHPFRQDRRPDYGQLAT